MAKPELSIVMPCLNESETLTTCIDKAKKWCMANDVAFEIVIADNGSTDGSIEIARDRGAKVVNVAEKGYGNALRGGIAAAKGKYIIMGDADDSYDFSRLDLFMEKLRDGYELVMGNRFKGGIMAGAMPPLHRYLGNPVLTAIGKIFFHSPCNDFHCGLRGFARQSILLLNLRTTGMEFASEMVIKATLLGLRITEVPIILHPDGRNRAPHLRSWRDGWRHLRFMLLYSPRWLFFYPGIFFVVSGVLASIRLLQGPVHFMGMNFDINTLLFTGTAIVIGYQAILFALFSSVYAVNTGLLPPVSRLAKLTRYFKLEIGLVLSVILIVVGIFWGGYAVKYWRDLSFGNLDPTVSIRVVMPAIVSLIIGVQTLFGSFFLSVLDLMKVPDKIH